MLAEPLGEAPPPELEGLEYQVIWGERDRIVSAPPGLRARLGHGLHLLRDAGHMPQLERAARVNHLIAGFIPE
jgi:pimeloyl-ACP methyl ester carboxylesterase